MSQVRRGRMRHVRGALSYSFERHPIWTSLAVILAALFFVAFILVSLNEFVHFLRGMT